MRIGVRLDVSRAHGALVHDGRLLATASVPRSPSTGKHLVFLLRELADHADSTVDSVTWDLSGAFESSLRRAAGAQRTDAPPARRVGALRLLPRSPYTVGHPSPLIKSLVAHFGIATGGHDLFGTELAPVDLDAAIKQAAEARAAGATTLAVTATGAPSRLTHEDTVAARLTEEFPDLRLCLSHEVGGMGVLQREATTVVNASLLDVAEELVTKCERVTGSLGNSVSCWFATGDGGRISPRRMRTLPVLGLNAFASTALLGAARISGMHDTAVLLIDTDTVSIGQVRDGLPHVESDLRGELGVRLAAPQAALTVRTTDTAERTAALLAEQSPGNAGVIAAISPGGRELAERLATRTRLGLTTVDSDCDVSAAGSAWTEPSAWLDLVVTVGSTEDLHRQQSLVEQRALTMVAANGAPPDSGRIIRSVATPLGFLWSDVYRLHVWATSGTPG
ncbi:hypothetical protein GCM10010174_86810 [Kutzneria viridogrisea]|uniref:Hydantoinase/oxoprolinase N-terminal domain-containing protein n=2 Tax=Kutzneria TaxID=43356 RepID=W5WKW0_9PSEU|nr:hypothetical protein [Kutzneria albida]AHI01844.1 hypothetical protein KALB_8487 [Kutzneria albida DSM 43870]MBA8929737.1 hypothetical protein [Kutzneria viridogrisea]